MASEYKKRGGDYNTDEQDKDESQKNLDKWTEEDWQTKEGDGNAKKENGTEKRYLPKKAWEQMSEEEKQETDEKKQRESKKGRQHVENTPQAKSAKKNGTKEKTEGANDCAQHWEDAVQLRDGQEAYDSFKDDEKTDGEGSQQTESENDRGSASDQSGDQGKQQTKKRGRGANQKGSSKRQKNGGDKYKANGAAGDKTRVPQEGQKVQWKALPGMVDGEVVEVVYEEKTVEGKKVKGSKEDPRIVLKSSSSGKIAVHKPEAVYFH
ncbi:hypothetical protein EJ04DRAFT_513348 [Polyplosphaeria fusca]|uniref:Hypervirulence associated protein TUDOR domain-containing protein n=1 Tax=Polyplosphaeria fusca TaxID=682080 RepID=A0A9P4QXV9_9PLEO|nr:hypothetical protein EJ04DRAFT_513348 [Polyplosphaeria fusca]